MNALVRAREHSTRALVYLVSGILVRLFWLFEATLDIRAYGTETISLFRRRGERPMLVIWHGKGFVPIVWFNRERLRGTAKATYRQT